MATFSSISVNRLSTVAPLLQEVMYEAIKDTPIDFMIVCGHRGKEEQNKAYKEGKSKLDWPLSKHNQTPSLAVDVCPVVQGKLVWDTSLFTKLANHIKETANSLGIPISWGGDWKQFKDRPHFELNNKHTLRKVNQ